MTVPIPGANRKILLGGTARSPEEVISLRDMGLSFAEITISKPPEFQLLIDKYRALQRETGLFYLCHGPREGDPNNLHTLETVYLPKLFQVLDIVPGLGMKQLTLHLWMDPRFVSKDVLDYKIGFLARVTRRAGAGGITVCLENLSESAAHLAEVFEAVPDLCLTLDLGHAELLSEENTSHGFLRDMPERIKHIHLHDNFGGSSPDDDLHLPPGEGRIDFPAIFDRLHTIPYGGTITMELRPEQIQGCLGYVKRLVYPEKRQD